MPSKSTKQARLMAACAHGAKFKSCPPPKVARDFNQADKGSGILRKQNSANKGSGILLRRRTARRT